MPKPAFQRMREYRIRQKENFEDEEGQITAQWTKIEQIVNGKISPEEEDKLINDPNFKGVCSYGPDGFKAFTKKYGWIHIKEPARGRRAFARCS